MPEIHQIILFVIIGPWDPKAMILMSPMALEMGPMIDVFC